MDISKLLKTVIIFSLMALVISILFCLIAKVTFLTLVVRSIVFFIVFGLLGAAIYIVYDRFLYVYEDVETVSKPSNNIGNKVDFSSDESVYSSENEELSSISGDESAKAESELDVQTSDIDLESAGGYSDSMSDLDELAENFASMGEGVIMPSSLDENIDVSGSELGEKNSSNMGGYNGGTEYGSNVSLEDIGGSDSTPKDYAKVVSTMLKRDE